MKQSEFEGFLQILKQNNFEIKRTERFEHHTTIGVGGKIPAYVEVFEEKSLFELLRLCQLHKVRYFVLGNGSNVLAGDRLKNLLVIRILIEGLSARGNKVVCGAGVNLFRLNLFCADKGLSGLEWSYGIPGSVGGAVCMNAGSFGGQMSDVVEKVFYTDGKHLFSKKVGALDFSYRHSFFLGNRFAIYKVVFKLNSAPSDEIKKKCHQFFDTRKKHQPYLERSAGSVFKRPPSNFAPVLIEKCGLKGKKCGDAQISSKHCGFVVNNGRAKFVQVFKLICKIKKTVFKKFGIMLEEEVVLIL